MFTALRSWAGCPADFTTDGSSTTSRVLDGLALRELSGGAVGRNKWFKHFNTASDGNSLSLLWAEGNHVAIAVWWRLLELVSKWEKEECRGRVTLSWSLLARELNMTRPKVRRTLAQLALNSLVRLENEVNETFSLFVPNWLELQETRGGKREAKKEQSAGRGKRKEERGEKKEQTAQNSHPLFEIWNQNRGSLPEAKSLTEKRSKKAESIWNKNPSTEYWTEVVCRMARSAFCRGEKNDPNGKHPNWKADFEFFLNPETHVKVSEGKYDDRAGQQEKKVYNLDDLKAMKL